MGEEEHYVGGTLQRNDTLLIQGISLQCATIRTPGYSKGLWAKNEFDQHLFPALLARIVLFSIVSRLAYFVLRPLRQPRFGCNILAGWIVGPHVLEFYVLKLKFRIPELFNVMQVWAWVGTIYYVFLLGVKMDTAVILRTGKKVWSIGAAGVVASMTGAVWLLRMHEGEGGLSNKIGALLVLLITTTPFPVVIESLEELNLLSSELGRLAMSISLILDVLRWVLLVLDEPLLLGEGLDVLRKVIALLVLLFFSVCIIRPMLRLIKKRTAERKAIASHLQLAIFIGALLMAVFSNFCGLPVTFGPFILGLVVPAGMPIGLPLVEKSEQFVQEALLPCYFMLMGNSIDLRDAKLGHFLRILPLLLTCMIGKFLGVTFAALRNDMNLKHAATLGLILNVKGWPEVLVILQWGKFKALTPQLFGTLVVAILGLTGIISPLIELLYRPPWRVNKDLDKFGNTIQSFSSNSEFRVLACFFNDEDVRTIIPLLEASYSDSHQNRFGVYAVHLLELSGRAMPLFETYKYYTILRGVGQNPSRVYAAFNKYLRRSQSRLQIKNFVMIAPFKSMYESICRFALDESMPLILVPFHKNQEAQAAQTTALRDFNAQIQKYAPCAVGILVDRGFRSHANTVQSYRVAVIFLGGPDDRETLAFASRLSSHPGVSMTVWRLWTSNARSESPKVGVKYQGEALERQLDDAVASEFKLKNLKNPYVVYHEIKVEDQLQFWDAVRCLDSNYDLVMVGKEQPTSKPFDSQMQQWSENAELGVIGDMVASKDFHGGTIPVLVMQHYRYNDRTYLKDAMTPSGKS